MHTLTPLPYGTLGSISAVGCLPRGKSTGLRSQRFRVQVLAASLSCIAAACFTICDTCWKNCVNWPVGLMDKASASGAGDSRFESWAGQAFPGVGSRRSGSQTGLSWSCLKEIWEPKTESSSPEVEKCSVSSLCATRARQRLPLRRQMTSAACARKRVPAAEKFVTATCRRP